MRIAARRRIETVELPAVSDVNAVEPTGVGDAFRAGFLAGLAWGLGLERSAQVGCVLAAYVVETVGTQEYSFTAGRSSSRGSTAVRRGRGRRGRRAHGLSRRRARRRPAAGGRQERASGEAAHEVARGAVRRRRPRRRTPARACGTRPGRRCGPRRRRRRTASSAPTGTPPMARASSITGRGQGRPRQSSSRDTSARSSSGPVTGPPATAARRPPRAAPPGSGRPRPRWCRARARPGRCRG